MESIQIYLHSMNADKYFNGSISDAEYILPPIEIPDGYHIYMSVQNVTIPYSFYNINDNNNFISYTVAGQTTLLSIINGNYNITQLVDFLNFNMVGFNITYSLITNKLTFSNTSDFLINSASTCLSTLGFGNTTYPSVEKILISVNCVNIMNVKRININSNFITYNINKATINNYSILCSVPVNKPAFSLIEYNNTNHFRTNLFINQISTIKIKLTDESGNLIDLNGCHYCITLQLDIEPFN